MKVERFKVIEYLLSRDDPLLVKRGLQALCDRIEGGYRIDIEQKREALRLISRHYRSENLLVRRWLYKALGLLRDRSCIPFLKGQFRSDETDLENLTWIVAALAALVPLQELVALVKQKGLEFYGTGVELAAGYFVEQYRINNLGRLRAILEEGDPLSLLWLNLIFGKSEGQLGYGLGSVKPLIRELNVHDDRRVAEYSIWALFKAQDGTFSDLSIAPQHLSIFPANIRRWYYRLLTKNGIGIDSNYDLIEEATTREREPEAREGLAMGLALVNPDEQIASLMISWFLREKNPLVRIQLVEHFARYIDKVPDYQEILAKNTEGDRIYEQRVIEAVEAERLPVAIIKDSLDSKRESLFLTQDKGSTLEMGIPLIASESVRESYILAVDTVGFSSESDEIQFGIFRDLLADFSGDRHLKGVRPEDFITLLTGDGLILVFKGEENRLLPLRLCLSILDRYNSTRQKKMRCGINNGPAYWIEMTDGSRQVIGHAINWAARVMASAEGNQVLVSGIYYQAIAQPARSELRGMHFEPIQGLKTKKDESIEAWSAQYPG